jgi:ribosomal protein S18 acetylase RimI-like enzyme
LAGVDELAEAARALREWQRDEAPMQLHPGDLGWLWRSGAEATAAAVRVWRRDGVILAVGMLDGDEQMRLAIAPEAVRDEDLARRLIADLTEFGNGSQAAGGAIVEVPIGTLVRDRLAESGWKVGTPWTPLRRDLADPVEAPSLRLETVGPGEAGTRAAVQRASFDGSSFSEESWRKMATGPLYADARCLLGYDDHDEAVATVTVWSAGPGRPGLIEPMGVHREHRNRGHGRAITLAAAAALRELGSSSAFVATPSSNVAAVSTYRAAGFEELAPVPDMAAPSSS